MSRGVKLTKTIVEAVPTEGKDVLVWDAKLPGFGLKVTPKGRRVYLLQYRPKGSKGVRRYTIGVHGAPWTTERAREAAEGLVTRVRLGEDPFVIDKGRRAEEARDAVESTASRERQDREAFDKVVDQFVTAYAKPKNRRWAETERILKHDAVKAWGARPVRSISRLDVLALVDKVKKRSPSAARALYAQLRTLFGWCLERDLVDASPCAGVKSPAPSVARDRFLDDREVGLVWRGCERLGGPFEPLFKLLLLTGQRREEVSGMRWSEVSLERAEWTIPASRTKNAKAHEVDLAPEVLGILKDLPRTGQLVFTTTGQKPLSGHSKAKARLDLEVERLRLEAVAERAQGAPELPLAPWRLHDLRRTAASGMAALGHPPHVIEAVLNHSSGARGGLVGVYQRYHHRPERKAALLNWAAKASALARS